MHTKDKLAEALDACGLVRMAVLASEGYYHDYMSPLAFPAHQLLTDLRTANSPASYALAQRVRDGEFDATAEEADAWSRQPEVARAIAWLTKAHDNREEDLNDVKSAQRAITPNQPKRPPDL